MSKLIHNERAKLRANAIDRVSTAFFVVGVLTLIIGPAPATAPLIAPLIWFVCGVVLHFGAQGALRSLRDE